MRYSRDRTHRVINNESFLNKNPNTLFYDDNEPSFFLPFFCVFLISLSSVLSRVI